MVLIRFEAALVILIAALATAAHQISGSSSTCKQNEFWYNDKGCCLPYNGPSSTSPPPQDTRCPPTGWYWGDEKGCCLPRNPPASSPPPQCPKHWEWIHSSHKCQPFDEPPPMPMPSGWGKGGKGHDYHSASRRGYRAHVSRASSACPYGLDACPVSGLSGDYECLDTAVELESCGGCASIGEGQDCTTIRDAWNVGCERGVCKVYTCAGGFTRAADGKSCIPF